MDYKYAKNFVSLIKKHIPGLYITGSIKRKEKTINDIDFITLKKLDKIYDKFKKYFGDRISEKKGGDKFISFEINGHKIDIWKANDKSELFFKRLLHDLDKGHVIGLHNKAKKLGYSLTENGLFKDGEKIEIDNFDEFAKKFLF